MTLSHTKSEDQVFMGVFNQYVDALIQRFIGTPALFIGITSGIEDFFEQFFDT